ncbi:glycosyltransferase family 2 protein [Phocaeicola sp.]
MMASPIVQVFILTRNRPKYLDLTLSSVLKQTYLNLEVIVSDNSTENETYNMLKKRISNRLRYVKRIPDYINAVDHFNKILSEVTSEYFIMFHDDDLMEANMVFKLVQFLNNNPNCVAACTNAYNIDENGNILERFSKILEDQIVKDKKELFNIYSQDISLPFPSFIYRRALLNDICFDHYKGGKYSDSCFILDLLNIGQIAFMYSYVGMFYRRSQFQDSYKVDLMARSKQIRYFCKAINLDLKSKKAKRWRLKELYITCCVEKRRFTTQLLHLFKKNGIYDLWIKALIKNILLNVSR